MCSLRKQPKKTVAQDSLASGALPAAGTPQPQRMSQTTKGHGAAHLQHPGPAESGGVGIEERQAAGIQRVCFQRLCHSRRQAAQVPRQRTKAAKAAREGKADGTLSR